MKTLLIAIVFGAFGAIAVSVSFAMHWPTWVMFIAWVSFYLFGKTVRSSALALLQIVLGIVMGVLMSLSAAFLGNFIGALGFPLAVFFFIGSLAYIMKLKVINNIPAWFLGLIIFFGVHPPVAPAPLLLLLVPIVAGFVFAWMNNKIVDRLLHVSRTAAHP
jgi:hypothetical protein